MKQAFVYPGGPEIPDSSKAKRYGITRFFWAANDPNATADRLRKTRSEAGLGVGLMRDPSWAGDSAVQLAEGMHKDLTDRGFGPTTGADSCAAMFDAEQPHDPRYHEAWLKRWRELRPTRTTLWTFEPMQGGWFDDALVAKINTDPNLILVPQLYFGTPRMYPVSERIVVKDLTNRGIREDRIVGFYDGEQKIPYGWNGIVYDFIKLPATPAV